MKRLFSNKSGFSLAEIVVAIAVFSIMMAMIMQMLRLSIDQRNQNLRFAENLNQQEEELVVNGKDTSPFPEDASPDGTVNLSFKKDPSDPSETPLDINMDYMIKATDPDATGDDIVEGINYFVGDFDYSADGTGSSGGGSSGNGVGQASKYDTRITGTKGLEDINIGVSKLPEGNPYGKFAYEITVSADSSNMQSDDIADSQLRLYFYSTTKWHDQLVEVKKKQKNAEGEMEEVVVDSYYKKVYDEAKIKEVIQIGDTNNQYVVSQISGFGVKVSMPVTGNNVFNPNKYPHPDGFKPSVTTKFVVVFNEDPGISASSFGKNGSSGTYNRSPIYDEKTGAAKIGKTHVNIYGSYPFETKKTESGSYSVGGAGD
ncbi:MAG: type II secretion system GspH family protein [Oscillospiraceae bacterium]|nr:type II secretion system GspH family protein [Oscillospiraceae bacterium]